MGRCERFLPKVGVYYASPYICKGDLTLGRIVNNRERDSDGERVIVLEDCIEVGKLHRKKLRVLLERCCPVNEQEVPIIQAAYKEAGDVERDARRAARNTTKGLVRLRVGMNY